MDNQAKATPSTPRPWNRNGWELQGEDREPILGLSVRGIDRRANLDFIVKAVNEYDKLKADNKALLEACREAKDLLNQLYREGHLNTDNTENKLSQAIANAEGR